MPDRDDDMAIRLLDELNNIERRSRQPMAIPIAEALEEGMPPEKIAERLIETSAPQDALTRFFVTRFGPDSEYGRDGFDQQKITQETLDAEIDSRVKELLESNDEKRKLAVLGALVRYTLLPVE
ncbi:hypothetical protein [Sediminispirochaeta bajacaliforniensis]|uniref:hypothetical protein n=1 Tax=Sediminispirochaeta bajacaliforniensis TaxID=148 RepID=UPI000361E77E|nr:hypothetical protein [Sediminispirochaeta bajacaliforniensis]